MKIQVTFESLEEFYQTFEGYNADGSLRLRRNGRRLKRSRPARRSTARRRPAGTSSTA